MSKLAAAGLRSTVAGRGAARGERPRGRSRPRSGPPPRGWPRAPSGRGRRPGSGLADPDRSRRSGRRPTARSATTGGRRRQVDALVAAAGDQDDRRVERAERGDDRVRLGPLRVVDEPDAVDDATVSRRCSTPVKPHRRAADRVGRDPEQRARSRPPRGRSRRCAGRGSRAQRSAGSGRPDPSRAVAAGDRSRRRRRDDPAVDARRRRPASARRAGTRRRGVPGTARTPATTGSSAFRTSAPRGSTSSASRRFDRAIALERAVAVEMVRRDVRVDRDGRAARQRRQLQLARAR